MRDIYVKVSSGTAGYAVPFRPTPPGYHANLKAFVYCIRDVPESVSESMALLAFNQCSVLGHTVHWDHLHKGQPVRGEGLAWDLPDLSRAII